MTPLVLALGAQATFSIASSHNTMLRALEDKAAVIGSLLLNVIGPSLVTEDPAAVQEGLGYVRNDPNFAFAVVLGPDGRRVGFAGTEPAAGLPRAAPTSRTVLQATNHVIFASPVLSGGKSVGGLFLGLKTDAVRSDVADKAIWASLISGLGILAAVGVVLWLARTVAHRAQAIEQLDSVLAHMRDVTQQVSVTARQVAAAADGVSDSAESIASGAQSQASATDETVALLAELAGVANQNAERAQDLAKITVMAEQTAAVGEEESVRATTAMEKISQASHGIDQITRSVGEIALQTNILALNAAVEAARAGEHGRGFAVVATEIGNLSQRSAESARAIKVLIDQTNQVVREGTQLVGQSGRSLQTIARSTRSLAEIVKEIATACSGQVSTIQSLHGVVKKVASVTRDNKTETAQLVAASRDMAAQSGALLARVDHAT